MNNNFIEKCIIDECTYQKKEGTKNSFKLVAGLAGILPKTLCLGIFAQKRISQNDKVKKNEINGVYNKPEEGIYKTLNNGKIHTSIWVNPEYPEFYGYGIIDERFNKYDLLILHSSDNCNTIFTIYLFAGLGKPEYINQTFEYLRDYNKKIRKPVA